MRIPKRWRRPILSWLVLGSLACRSQSGQAEPPRVKASPAPPSPGASQVPKEQPMSSVAKIDWTMTPVDGGKALKIDYRVTSLSDKRIYLSDLLPLPGDKTWKVAKNEIIVRNGDEPGTVIFARARVRSEAPLPFLVDPGARALDPGKTATGSAQVALPLKAQHYRGTVAPLQGNKTTAILELGYISGDAHWEELPLDDGNKLTVSQPSDKMEYLRSEPKPIPSK